MADSMGTVATMIIAFLAVGSVIFFIGRWVGTVDSRDSAFSGIMQDMSSDVESIKDIAVKTSSDLAQSSSPLQLTPDGEKVVDNIGAKEWARKLAQTDLSKYRTLQAFEIDDHARKWVDKDQSKQVRQMIAMARYQFGLDEATIRSALAITLRDALLETG